MDDFILVTVTLVAIVMLVLVGLTFVPGFATRTAYRHAALVGIGLPPDLEHAAAKRLMASARGGSIGAFVFVFGATIVAQATQGNGDETGASRLALWSIVGATVTGLCVGTAVAAFIGGPVADPDAPRVARSGAVTVADYLHPVERVVARLLVVLAATVVTWSLLAAPESATTTPLVVLAVLGVASLVLFEVVSRRVVERSQPAGSTADLVWDDALRSSTLRDLVSAPVALGAIGVLFGAVQLITAGGALDGSTAAETVGVLTPFLVIAVSLYSRAAGLQRYFLRRLWPNLRWSDTADATSDPVSDRA